MAKSLTIGYILDDTLDVTDGVQQATISIAEKMRSYGHEVHYIVSETKRTDLENIHSIGKSYALKFNGNSVRTPLPTRKRAIIDLFNNIDFDVLHVQMPYSPFFAAQVINNAPEKIKIFGTFHILPYNLFSKFGTNILGKLLKKSQARIGKSYAVSEPALAFMESTFGLSGEVLPNPVDYNFYKSAKSKKEKNKTNIVFVGRFEQRKGVKQLIQAYKLLKDKHNLKFVMCGKGPLYKELIELVNTENLDIEMPGFVSEKEKAERLSGADIAIFPSTSGESFGIVLTEAMSAGSEIVLGGNNPGYESVLHPWPETLFDASNPEKIAECLWKFIEDRELRHSIGVKQHLKAKDYDIEIVASKLLEDYIS